MKWFLCAQRIGQVAVRSRGRLLPKDALNRRLATGSCLPPSSASPVVGNIAKSFSAASPEEKLCSHKKLSRSKENAPKAARTLKPKTQESRLRTPSGPMSMGARNPSALRLRSSPLAIYRALCHPQAMKWFLCAQSIGQVAVRFGVRLLPKDALNRRLATGSCLPPSSASPVVGNIAKSFSAASPEEKLCSHKKLSRSN
ncbi:unnamed protein product [Coccothraustes coccothraustes]